VAARERVDRHVRAWGSTIISGARRARRVARPHQPPLKITRCYWSLTPRAARPGVPMSQIMSRRAVLLRATWWCSRGRASGG